MAKNTFMQRRSALQLMAAAGLQPILSSWSRAQPAAERSSFARGDVRRYGMSPDAAPDVNTAALQRCLNESAGHTAVMIPGADREYRLSGRITAPSGSSIVLGDGAALHWVATQLGGTTFLGTPCRPGIEVLGDEFRLTGKGRIIGPSSGQYVANEIALLCLGSSAAAHRKGLTVTDGVEFSGWGSRGITAQFVADIAISRVKVRNCGYAGMQFLSCRSGRIQENEVRDIGPGASGNAYGISCSHDSRGYAEDPQAVEEGRHARNHFCIAFEIARNTVHNIPVWVGIDCHGAYDCNAHDNRVFNCRHGLLIQGSSDTAKDFAGDHNSITNNSVTTRRMNGDPTTVTAIPRLGISIDGGKRVRHRYVTVRDNTIDGFGDSKHTSFSIQHTYTSDVEISNNRVLNWRGYGCYSAYSQGAIDGNDFGPVADPAGTACIFVAIGGDLKITRNRHEAPPQAAAQYGVVINTPSDAPYVIRENDFRAVHLRQYSGRAGAQLSSAQIAGGRIP